MINCEQITEYLSSRDNDGLGWLREEISKTVVQKPYKRDWFDNCKPDEDY